MQGLGGQGSLCTWPIGHPPGVGWRGEGPISATSFGLPCTGFGGLWWGVVWRGVVWCGVVLFAQLLTIPCSVEGPANERK